MSIARPWIALRAATAPGRTGRSRNPSGPATSISKATAIAERVAWNCHSPASAAITRTKLSVNPMIIA